MPLSSPLGWLLLLGLLALRPEWVWAQTGRAQTGTTPSRAVPLMIDARFGRLSLNDRLWVNKAGRADRTAMPPRPDLDWARNTEAELVRIGPAYRWPQAWLLVGLHNATAQPRPLIVDLDHNRCDTLEAFLQRGHQLTSLGHWYRGQPLAQRPWPLLDYVVPFTLAPHESATLVLRSSRTTGGHELSLTLSTPPQFLTHWQQQHGWRLLAMGCAGFFTATVLALGSLFGHRLLVYFGLYGLALTLGQLNYNYYFDPLPFPPWLGLTANAVGLLIIFLVNALSHPFCYAYLRGLGLLWPGHAYPIGLLAGANSLAVIGLLFPLTPLTNTVLTQASWLLSTLNIGWLLYVAGLSFIRKGELYLLLTAALVCIPLLYHTYHQATPSLSYHYLQPFYYLLLFGGLTVALLRRELSSRQRTQRQLHGVQTRLEQLRQAEVARLGRQLHDQLGNTLASALGYLTMHTPQPALAQTMIHRALEEARLLSHNLVKDDGRPLTEKLADLTERLADFAPMGFSYRDFTGGSLNALPGWQQQAIYLIVQEGLTNALKHSGARQVTVQTVASEGRLRVSVEDDGVGYVPTDSYPGIGLRNMQQRAVLAGLALVLESSPGGSWLSLEAPQPRPELDRLPN